MNIISCFFLLQFFFSSGDNQFGFKLKYLTDIYIFALKQTIDYYMSVSSPMYICYIDTSKAFGRINFNVFFLKQTFKMDTVYIGVF